MLVLTRRVGEVIVIDGRIRVLGTAVEGDKAKLGIEAPASVRIDREEIHARRCKEAPPVRTLETAATKAASTR